MNVLAAWFKRYFSNPEIVFLLLFLLTTLIIITSMSHMLAPFLASVVIAYLLEGLVSLLEKYSLPRFASVLIVFSGFMLIVLLILFALLPLLSKQLSQLFQDIPLMLAHGQRTLMQLPETYPEIFSQNQIDEVLDAIKNEVTVMGQKMVSMSISSVVSIITLLVYLILTPLLVFFFLKDKRLILDWIGYLLPKRRKLAGHVWEEVDCQIGNYVRGKFWEIVIIWAVSLGTFTYLDLQYAMLLAVLVGLSVIIPYIGAAVVTFPVILIAWFQWGWGSDFIWLASAYFVIQALDGNVLVPLLFSEVVNLHPVAIILAILVFGGFWGFWGVFFAIPLATLVQSILTVWPSENPA